jgi:hypothetical protein
VGEEELRLGKFKLKNLDSGEEKALDIPGIVKALKK